MSLARWGLSEADIPQLVRLARRFHEDFDLERLSFRQALDAHVALLSPDEREQLGDELEVCLAQAGSSDDFDRLFVAAGAKDWPSDDDLRSDLVDWLERQA